MRAERGKEGRCKRYEEPQLRLWDDDSKKEQSLKGLSFNKPLKSAPHSRAPEVFLSPKTWERGERPFLQILRIRKKRLVNGLGSIFRWLRLVLHLDQKHKVVENNLWNNTILPTILAEGGFVLSPLDVAKSRQSGQVACVWPVGRSETNGHSQTLYRKGTEWS